MIRKRAGTSFGLYLDVEHRGKDTSIAIHEAVLDFLRVWTETNCEIAFDEKTGMEKARKARVGGTLGSQDPMLRELYEALGGYEVGSVGIKEALRMVGNKELVVDGGDGADGGKRIIAMEGLIEC